VPSPGGVDNYDLPGLLRDVEKRVWHTGRQVGETSFAEVERLITDPDLVLAGEDVDRLLLDVVHMQRRPAVRCDLDDEVVKGSARVLSGDLENQIPTRARLQSKALAGCEYLRGKSCHVVSSRSAGTFRRYI
jgi:hypothetical protein